jgi:hypothetical protein
MVSHFDLLCTAKITDYSKTGQIIGRKFRQGEKPCSGKKSFYSKLCQNSIRNVEILRKLGFKNF